MNIKDLKYLVAVAESGHFGKAADICFVSQPALSMQIQKLESSLGVQLLERGNKSVTLTEPGIEIVERARKILGQVDELREFAKESQDPFSGELRLGVFPSLAPYLLPLIIPTFSRLYPKVSFYLIEEQSALLIEKLKQGKLHAAFLAAPVLENNLKSQLLFEEEFLLALPKAHPLAKQKYVQQQDLDNKNLLLLEEGHCMRDQALAVCQRMRAKETTNFRATSMETLGQMVAAGVGLTLLPKLACLDNKGMAYLPFNDPKPQRSIGLYWRSSSAKQVLLQDLAEQIKKLLKKHSAVSVLA